MLGALLRDPPQEADLSEPFGAGILRGEEYNPSIHADITNVETQTKFFAGSRWVMDRYCALIPLVSHPSAADEQILIHTGSCSKCPSRSWKMESMVHISSPHKSSCHS